MYHVLRSRLGRDGDDVNINGRQGWLNYQDRACTRAPREHRAPSTDDHHSNRVAKVVSPLATLHANRHPALKTNERRRAFSCSARFFEVVFVFKNAPGGGDADAAQSESVSIRA